MNNVDIRVGDALTLLKDMPCESVDCVVTSPPYWGLRDYGVAGQMGLEPTLYEHLAAMVGLFDEVWRVLKPLGTVFVNYGDCYATSPNGRSAADTKALSDDDRTFRDKPFSTIQGVLKPKDLCMVPNRFAIAMQEVGWWVRSEIIWAKPNPMPESITDRPGTAHEKIWLFTKSARYHWDAKAVRQKGASDTMARYSRGRSKDHKYADGGPGNQTIAKSFDHMINPKVAGWVDGKGAHSTIAHNKGDRKAKRGSTPRHKGHIENTKLDGYPRGLGRNIRNYEPAPVAVWKIATRPFSEAHFATFPPELVERCLSAGCPEGGMALDPFGGAGTTGLVAQAMGFDSILLEINPEYAELAARRIRAGLGRVTGVEPKPQSGPLFEDLEE